MSIIRLLGLALVVAVVTFFTDCKGNKNGDEASQGDTLSLPSDEYEALVSEQDPVITETSATNQETAQVDEVMMEDKNGVNIVKATEEAVSNGKAFYIIAGSFTLYKNASALNKQLKAKGYDSKLLEPYGQYNRVAIKEFATADEARKALPEFRSKIDRTLWVLVR